MIELLLAADRLLAAGDLKHAERIYGQVATADPRNAIAVVGLARVAHARGDEPAALDLARRALAIDPEEVAAQLLLDASDPTRPDVKWLEPAPARRSMRTAVFLVVTLAGMVAAGVVALVAVMTLEQLLIPELDGTDFGHGIALGVSEIVWGLLSLGILAGVARVALGRDAVLGRGDLFAAVVVLVLLGGWTTGLHSWVVANIGYFEPDFIGRGTYVWPAIVILVTIALAAVRITRGRVRLGLLAFAALAFVALLVQTVLNGLGALADGEVSGAGLIIGVLSGAQLAVLGGWWWAAARGRVTA